MRRLAAGLALVLVVACSPTAVSTPGPTVAGSPDATAIPTAAESEAPAQSAPVEASVEPTAVATPTAAAPEPTPVRPSVLPPGSAIEVTIAELNMREGPSTGAKRVEVLKRGQVLVVSPFDGVWFGAGPVKRNGYTWYAVIKLQTGDADGDLPALPTRPILLGTEVEIGWIATDDGDEDYVKLLAPRCPGTVDLRNVQAMLSWERLSCLDGQFVLEGIYGCPVCGAELTGDFEPVWLSYPQALGFLSIDAPASVGPLILRFPPEVESPAQGSIIRATVHVDDPRARGCTVNLGNGEPVTPAATAELYCRSQVVVDSFEVLGVDPDFNT